MEAARKAAPGLLCQAVAPVGRGWQVWTTWTRPHEQPVDQATACCVGGRGEGTALPVFVRVHLQVWVQVQVQVRVQAAVVRVRGPAERQWPATCWHARGPAP